MGASIRTKANNGVLGSDKRQEPEGQVSPPQVVERCAAVQSHIN